MPGRQYRLTQDDIDNLNIIWQSYFKDISLQKLIIYHWSFLKYFLDHELSILSENRKVVYGSSVLDVNILGLKNIMLTSTTKQLHALVKLKAK